MRRRGRGRGRETRHINGWEGGMVREVAVSAGTPVWRELRPVLRTTVSSGAFLVPYSITSLNPLLVLRWSEYGVIRVPTSSLTLFAEHLTR